MLSRRNFLASVATVAGGLQAASLKAAEAPASGSSAANGRAKVYVTKDLSAAGLLKLTVMGRGRALIEQHRGLAGYTHERIEVLGGRTRLIINGEALELAAMDREALLVTGLILSVEFE